MTEACIWSNATKLELFGNINVAESAEGWFELWS